MVGPAGLEPATSRLKACYSTIELRTHFLRSPQKPLSKDFYFYFSFLFFLFFLFFSSSSFFLTDLLFLEKFLFFSPFHTFACFRVPLAANSTPKLSIPIYLLRHTEIPIASVPISLKPGQSRHGQQSPFGIFILQLFFSLFRGVFLN